MFVLSVFKYIHLMAKNWHRCLFLFKLNPFSLLVRPSYSPPLIPGLFAPSLVFSQPQTLATLLPSILLWCSSSFGSHIYASTQLSPWLWSRENLSYFPESPEAEGSCSRTSKATMSSFYSNLWSPVIIILIKVINPSTSTKITCQISFLLWSFIQQSFPGNSPCTMLWVRT